MTDKVSLKDFVLLKVLGKGSFGKVLLVRKTENKQIYAMKVLIKENIRKRNQVEHTKTERSVLGKMNHPFIVTLRYAFQVHFVSLAWCLLPACLSHLVLNSFVLHACDLVSQTSRQLFFVLDFVPGGELFFHLGRAVRDVVSCIAVARCPVFRHGPASLHSVHAVCVRRDYVRGGLTVLTLLFAGPVFGAARAVLRGADRAGAGPPARPRHRVPRPQARERAARRRGESPLLLPALVAV
jgi:hypothetical protein